MWKKKPQPEWDNIDYELKQQDGEKSDENSTVEENLDQPLPSKLQIEEKKSMKPTS